MSPATAACAPWSHGFSATLCPPPSHDAISSLKQAPVPHQYYALPTSAQQPRQHQTPHLLAPPQRTHRPREAGRTHSKLGAFSPELHRSLTHSHRHPRTGAGALLKPAPS